MIAIKKYGLFLIKVNSSVSRIKIAQGSDVDNHCFGVEILKIKSLFVFFERTTKK